MSDDDISDDEDGIDISKALHSLEEILEDDDAFWTKI